jgi:hypothetical protein
LMTGIEINHAEGILHFLNQITVFWSGMYIIFASLGMMAARGHCTAYRPTKPPPPHG